MCGKESVAISVRVRFDRGRDRRRPPARELRIELLRAAVDGARTLSPCEQPGQGHLGAVPAMEDPCDPEVLLVRDPTRKDLAGLPGIGQLVIGHHVSRRHGVTLSAGHGVQNTPK